MIAMTGIVSNMRPKKSDKVSEAKYDMELVRRFNAGDSEAFEEIVMRHREKMSEIAYSFLRNHADAEEISQDVFIRAHRGLANFRGDSALATWLHRIALNLSKNRYWYFFRRQRNNSISLDCPTGDYSGNTIAGCISSSAQSPSQEVVTSEFVTIVSESIQKLPRRHCEILWMRIIQNRSYKDIAEILCLNVGTVKSRIARARDNLLALIAEEYPELAGDDLIELIRSERIEGIIRVA